MLVEIFSDTVCPWCYLGKRRFERALAARPGLEVDVRWLPFELTRHAEGAGRQDAVSGAQEVATFIRILDDVAGRAHG